MTTNLSTTALIRFLVFVFGTLIIHFEANQSADFWNYYDRFADRGELHIDSILGMIQFIWSSQSFYLLMGLVFDLSPVLPYYAAWFVLWFGLCAYGFRGIHWCLFFCFFPGPDLLVNLIRQEFALGLIALIMSWGSPALAVTAFLFHPSSLVSVAFLYVAKIFESVFLGSIWRSLLLVVVIGGATVWIFNSPFFGMALAKLDAKRGLAQFGSRFIYFVYIEFAILAFLCLSIRSRVQRLIYFGLVVTCLVFTVIEIYFYRFLYAFYPFVIFEIGQALRIQAGARKHLLAWLSVGGRYGVVSMSGMFVMLSLLR